MIPFAVSIRGVSQPGQGHWVLAVEGKRLLVVHEDRSLQWHQMDECTFVKLIPPDAPHPVLPVQPKQGLVVAKHGIAEMRNGS